MTPRSARPSANPLFRLLGGLLSPSIPRPRQVLSAGALRRHRVQNRRQSLLLGGSLLALFAGAGFLFGGPDGVLLFTTVAIVSMLGGSVFSRPLALRLFRARPLHPGEAPAVHAELEALTARAGLPEKPRLYRVPSGVPLAFTTGSGARAAVALSDGLLRTLGAPERFGVLAHEVAHLRHGDTVLLSFGAAMIRLVNLAAWLGLLLLLLNLPVILQAPGDVPWGGIALLLLAAPAMRRLWLALSRSREFAADLGAVELTGDPLGLARALERIDPSVRPRWIQWMFPVPRDTTPMHRRTHPPTAERVRRLLALLEPVPSPRWASPFNLPTFGRR